MRKTIISVALFILATALFMGDFQTTAAQQNIPDALIEQLVKDDQYVREKMNDENLTTKQVAGLVNSVKNIDLNGDGTPEMIVSGIICGTANCSTWIYRKKGTSFEQIPFDSSDTGLQVLKTKTQDFFDLKTESHDSAATSFITVYKFDGKGYKRRQCFEKSYVKENRRTGQMTTLKNPVTKEVPCSEN